MAAMNSFRRQFLFSSQKNFPFPWSKTCIADYTLYCHPELEYTHSSNLQVDLWLLGALYDWEQPELSNQQILDTLASTDSFPLFLKRLSKYAGEYVVIYKNDDGIILLNDVCAQKEIYYDTSYTSFGSQPKLIQEVILLEPHTSQDIIELYSSPAFKTKKIFIGETTHAKNIKHLLPNHYIDVHNRSVMRFFPQDVIEPVSTKDAAAKACQMLKGYIRAISLRNKMAIAVTAGNDSRVLFLASLDLECKYFVSQHKNMSDHHYDITIPRRLTQLYGKQFEVIPDNETLPDVLQTSIDFPATSNQPDRLYEDHIYLNGNLSEIARNFYGDYKNISAGDLAFIRGYPGMKFVEAEYNRWLKQTALFVRNGYHVLDMFYWEQVMGSRVAKEKTEKAALGRTLLSPFCSRDLLVLMLSTPRKDRNYYRNKLYDSILLGLSDKALDIPINPKLKLKVIRWMTVFKIYNIYRELGMKYRFLKF